MGDLYVVGGVMVKYVSASYIVSKMDKVCSHVSIVIVKVSRILFKFNFFPTKMLHSTYYIKLVFLYSLQTTFSYTTSYVIRLKVVCSFEIPCEDLKEILEALFFRIRLIRNRRDGVTPEKYSSSPGRQVKHGVSEALLPKEPRMI